MNKGKIAVIGYAKSLRKNNPNRLHRASFTIPQEIRTEVLPERRR